MKIVAVVPAYNETRHIESVLNKLGNNADSIVLVNDGSTDDTEEKVLRWGRDKGEKLYYLKLKKNLGMAGALLHGFRFITRLLAEKKIADSDIIVTLDADGQHDPDYIPPMFDYFRKNNLDFLLAKRDLSDYPLIRRLGNAALSLYSSILSGYRYRDVECGFRLLKAFIVPIILAHYYIAYRYAHAQMIAITIALLHYKVDNNFTIISPYYRQGNPGILDALVHIAASAYVFLRLICCAATLTTPVYESDTD